MALVDYFLKIDGISGESTDLKHKGEIEIDSFSWGLARAATGGGGGGAGAGRTVFRDFHFSTLVNISSPNLMLKCATGQHLKHAVLTGRKAGGDPKSPAEFLKVTFTDVLVSGYADAAQRPPPNGTPNDIINVPFDTVGGPIGGAGPAGTGVPVDSVALRYAQVQYSIDARTFFVPAAATGQIRFDPSTGRAIAFDPGNGILTVGSVGGMTLRGVEEFNITDLIGLLTAPFSTAQLTLVVAQVQGVPGPTGPPGPTTTAAASLESTTTAEARAGTAAAKTPKPPKPQRYDVIIYTPADGVITVEDLTRRGTRIGTITVRPNADLATLEIDLLAFLRKHHVDLSTFGIRLQLRGAGVGSSDQDDEDDHAKDEHDGDNNDDEHNDRDDDKPKTRPDVSAAFMLDLVLVTA